MPDKSRRSRAKHSAQGKKRKDKIGRPAMLAQQPAVAQTHEPVSSPKVPVSPVSLPTPMAKQAAISHPSVAAELRTIGILAGVMLIVLVVLAFVLS
jgi:hypothetical protein